MAIKCIRSFISGRVQGVFFRDSTRRQALNRGISGHAINLSDGRVEVVACGAQNDIEELINWLNSGPEYARVSSVKVENIQIEPPQGFIIR